MSENALQLTNPKSLAPTNMQEAMEFSEIIANSSFAPKGFQGRPGDVLIAIQMGMEVGLPPMAALQNIAVINGRPSIWGAAALAVVKAHPDCKGVIETYDADTRTAVCLIKRRNQPDVERSFSWEDACQAGYDKKSGPWQTHPKRMLQMRARGFAMNDQFPDALKGLCVREESEDIPAEPVRPRRFAQTENGAGPHSRLIGQGTGAAQYAKQEAEFIVDGAVHNGIAEAYVSYIESAATREELTTLFREARKAGGWSSQDAEFAPIVEACKRRAEELDVAEKSDPGLPPAVVANLGREPGVEG
jgi:hypothetical protein